MKAAIFQGNGVISIQDVPIPKITQGKQVLLKVEAASICGTDVHITNVPQSHPGKVGIVLGHEYIGEIVETGPEVVGYEIGDRVALDPNIRCGECYYCKLGKTSMCKHITCLGIDIDGGFAQYNVLPSSCLIKIPKELPVETAIFAEPMACVVNAMRKINFQVGESALVLGTGPIGLYFIQMLKSAGAEKIIATEVSSFRTKYAYESGADIVVNPNETDLDHVIRKETVDGVDVAIDTVGTLINQTIKCTRAGGRVMLFGMNTNAKQEIMQSGITRKDLTLLSSYISEFMFSATVQLLASKKLPLEKLITHKLPLEEIGAGLDAMRKGEALEVVLYPWQ